MWIISGESFTHQISNYSDAQRLLHVLTMQIYSQIVVKVKVKVDSIAILSMYNSQYIGKGKCVSSVLWCIQ